MNHTFRTMPQNQEYVTYQRIDNPYSYKPDHEVCYPRGNDKNYKQHPNNQQYQNNRQYQRNTHPRPSTPFNNRQQIKKEKNPYDSNGIQLSCDICESIYHMAQSCSKKRGIYHTQETILFQSDFGQPDKLKH